MNTQPRLGDDDGVWLANVFLSLTLRERIELFEYPGTQLTSMEEHWLEPTREYLLQRRAHWISQKEQDPDGFEHYMFDEAIKECDDWVRTPADIRRLAFFVVYGY